MSDFNNVKNVQPLADFNWDEFENGSSSNVSKQDLEKAYDETLNKIQEHEVVEGTVISIDKKEVVVLATRWKSMWKTRRTRRVSWYFLTRRLA